VLVVDGVELVAVDHPHEMRELHRQDARLREQDGEAADEIVEIGTCARTLLPSRRSADKPRSTRSRAAAAKKRTSVGMPSF